jgi:hypothetical protein
MPGRAQGKPSKDKRHGIDPVRMARHDSRKPAGESGISGQLGLSANLCELVGVPRAFGMGHDAPLSRARIVSK